MACCRSDPYRVTYPQKADVVCYPLIMIPFRQVDLHSGGVRVWTDRPPHAGPHSTDVPFFRFEYVLFALDLGGSGIWAGDVEERFHLLTLHFDKTQEVNVHHFVFVISVYPL